MKLLAWIASLLLLGTIVFWSLRKTEAPLAQPAPPATPQVAASTPTPSAPQSRPPLWKSRMAQKAESEKPPVPITNPQPSPNQMVNDSMKSVAAIMTPERLQEIVDSRMRTRDSAYRDILAQWSIDPTTMAKALDIIRQRELQTMRNRTQYFSKGTGGTRAYQKAGNSVNVTAEMQLTSLLGPDCSAALSRLDAQLNAESIARGRDLVRNRGRE